MKHNMGVGFLAVGVLGSCLSWLLLIRFGRRTIYNTGLAFLAFLQLLIGILDCITTNRTQIIWAEASILIVWNFLYNLTIGPVGFLILCESSAMRVREKMIAFATAVQDVVGIGMIVAVPYLINLDQAALCGKLGFFFGGTASLLFVWAYFRIPEAICWLACLFPVLGCKLLIDGRKIELMKNLIICSNGMFPLGSLVIMRLLDSLPCM